MKKKMIFILGTIIFILLLTGRPSFAQNFVSVNGLSLYPSASQGNFIPPSSNYAVLSWSMVPAANVSGVTHHVTSAEIIPSYTVPDLNISTSTYGWVINNNIDDVSYIYTIIDSGTMYLRTDVQLPTRYLNEIQSILVTKNLGTVFERQELINSYNGIFSVSPFDFRSMLSGWIWAGIVVFLVLPFGWFIFKRFLRS